MSYHVIYMPQAKIDIRDIATYLHDKFGFPIAMRFLVEIRDYCAGFSDFPERGTRRDDIQPGFRTVAYKRHATIGFAIRDDKIVILRVWNRGRDTIL